jgi:Dolichyl-phosphate-mannose-protein mannosyltransferase
MSRRGKLAFALLIFGLSFATRSLHAVDLAPVMYTFEQPFGGLTIGYDQRAVSILNGEGLLGPYDVEASQTMSLSQAPGYSIYLSAIYRVVGRNFFNVQLIQNCVNSLGPVLIFLIAGRVLSWRVGSVAGMLAALSHHLSHISNFILPDSLCALPILAAAYCLTISSRGTRSYVFYSLAGALMGISTWLRPQSMLLGVFAACVLSLASCNKLATLKRAALLSLVSILVIAPITLRNHFVYHAFLPVNLGIGLNLWEGIGEASGDRFGAVARDEEVAAQEAILYGDPHYAGSMYTPDGIARDRDRTAKSLAIIRQHPFWYAGVMLSRMRGMLSYSAQAPLVYRVDQGGPEQTAPIRKGWESFPTESSSLAAGKSIFWMRPVIRPLQRLTKEAMQLMIALGTLAFFIASWRRAMFISIVPIYYLLFQSVVHTEFRYTLPMQYFVFVFAAVAWVLIGTAMWQGLRRLVKRKAANSRP